MDTVVFLVRQNPDRSSDVHAFRDFDLATEAAEVVGGWVEEEPLLEADFLAELRQQSGDADGAPA